MTEKEYIESIKLELTGGILTLELTDEQLRSILKLSLQEVQRYIDTTEFITVPYASCIDINKEITTTPEGEDTPRTPYKKIGSVTKVYRVEGYTGDTAAGREQTVLDPMYAQTWMAFTNGGTMYNLNDYFLNFAAYNTMLQLRNTTSTDMAFKQDHQKGLLYINAGFDKPAAVTIEYVPVFENVEDIKSNYWTDILRRMFLARTKVILGRIRTRYTANSSLWQQDGETILAEGQEELKNLEEILRVNSQIIYPID